MSEQQAVVQVFDFEQRAVRVELIEGEPWWVARDVALALGYPESTADNAKRMTDHIPEEWKGRYPIPTPGGAQEILCLSEQGLYFFLARSDKPAALPFQKWIAGEVLPSIRKTGQYAVAALPKTPGEMFLESAQRFLDNERRMMALETEQRVLAQQVGSLMQSRAEGEALLRALPAPTVEAREVPVRARINQAVQAYIHAHGLRDQAAGEVWRRLYREFLAAYDVDLVQRAKNRCVQGRKVGALDIAEELDTGKRPGTMAELYAVAVRILGHPTRALGLVAPDALEG
jgi:prophage antirepressor-like protein